MKKESASILMVDRVDLSVREKTMPAGRRGQEQKEKKIERVGVRSKNTAAEVKEKSYWET